MIESRPKFIQGVTAFTGQGYAQPVPLGELGYQVPADRRAQLIYLRAGNSCDEMISLALLRDGVPMRHFPVGAKAAIHIPLAVVEDLDPDSRIEVTVAAPGHSSGTVVLDIGILEI